VSRRLTTLLVAAATAVCFVPIAQAASTVTLRPTAESWYQSDPTCGLPTGCVTTLVPLPLPDLPVSIYPARTMHVALSGGVESARTYVALGTAALTGTAGSSTISIPLDPDPLSGSVTPEKAKVQACLFKGALPAVEGSLGAPPVADCSAVSLLSYNAVPQPHLEGDLDALLPGLPGASGIVLLPDSSNSQPTDAWHVAFSAHDRSEAGAPAALSITVTTADEPAASPDEPVTEPAEPDAGPPAVAPAPGLGLGPVTQPEQGPSVPPAVSVAPAALPRTYVLGFAYPVVFVFPLLMLIAVPGLTRLLTRDLTPTRFQS
jgi:hypothetical protein